MTLGLSDQRRRSQRRKRSFRVILSLLVVVAAGVVGYQLGVYSAERPVYELEDTIESLRTENTSMNEEIQELVSVVATLKDGNDVLQQRYERDVPNEAERRILELAKGKLSAGVSFDRLAFVVDAVENERTCAGAAVTKRFIVQTPLHSGANSSVAFADGAITVTAEGASSRSETGAVEAWFDPGQPIKVRFTKIGGGAVEAEGKLPVHKSIVLGGTEHRFSLTQGPRGFIYVAGDQCDYP